MNRYAPAPPRMLAVVTLVTLCTGAAAGTNLPEGYPEPACGERPDIPQRPEKFETEEGHPGVQREGRCLPRVYGAPD